MPNFEIITKPLRSAFEKEQRKPTIILLSAPLLMVTWRYAVVPEQWANQALGAAVSFLLCLLLLGVVPALIVVNFLGESLADYGVRLGEAKRTFRTMAIFTPVFVITAYVASFDPSVRAEYPVNPQAGESAANFGVHVISLIAFYAGWEFFFRGYMQHGLRASLGDTNALLVQVMASCLLHLGKPGGEIYTSILGGILWGLLAYRTKSLLSGFVQHFTLGVVLDACICFG